MNVLKKVGVGIVMAVVLAGCGGTKPIIIESQKAVVVIPDQSMFVCPQTPLPDPDTMTDVDVAKLINALVRDNRVCGYNMKQVYEFLNKAKEKADAAYKK